MGVVLDDIGPREVMFCLPAVLLRPRSRSVGFCEVVLRVQSFPEMVLRTQSFAIRDSGNLSLCRLGRTVQVDTCQKELSAESWGARSCPVSVIVPWISGSSKFPSSFEGRAWALIGRSEILSVASILSPPWFTLCP